MCVRDRGGGRKKERERDYRNEYMSGGFMREQDKRKTKTPKTPSHKTPDHRVRKTPGYCLPMCGSDMGMFQRHK